jgi:hypothetical protein
MLKSSILLKSIKVDIQSRITHKAIMAYFQWGPIMSKYLFSAGAETRAPPKIGKKLIFLASNRDFSHEIPQKFPRLPPLGAIFLSAPPLT